MVADIDALHKYLKARIKIYIMKDHREPTLESLAQLLSNTLYSRRFMPYYTFNLLCGMTVEGEGMVYGYDAIGSYDKLTYGVQGSGTQLGAPILDNQFFGHNFLVKKYPTNLEDTLNTQKDILHGIAERDIYTGDNIEFTVITNEGIRVTREPLRRD